MAMGEMRFIMQLNLSSKKKKNILNFVISLVAQLIIISLGIIIPRLVMDNYGSDTNGLVNTVTQVFSYMSLLQAGVFAAAVVELYKPVMENDTEQISKVVSYSKSYYKKIAIIYGLLVIVISFVLPLIMKTEVDYFTVFTLVFFEGLTGVVSFSFLSSWQIVLRVHGKNYIIDTLNLLQKVMCYVVKIILVYLSVNIAFVQVAYFLASLVIIAIYKIYMTKKYSYISYNIKSDYKLVNRNAYFVNELAGTLNNSTDLIVLSIFLSTNLSSVYSVYNMVITYIVTIVTSVYNSTSYILGQDFTENIEKYKRTHDIFTSIFMIFITTLLCVCFLLMIPFVKLYTEGITDANYLNIWYPVLFCSISLINWIANPPREALGVAGYAKQMSIASIITAIINLVISISLVYFLGILGVLIGTIVSAPIRSIYYNYLMEKKLLKRSGLKTIIINGVNILIFIITGLFYFLLPISIDNYWTFILYGILLTIGYFIVILGVNLLVNRDLVFLIKQLLVKVKIKRNSHE